MGFLHKTVSLVFTQHGLRKKQIQYAAVPQAKNEKMMRMTRTLRADRKCMIIAQMATLMDGKASQKTTQQEKSTSASTAVSQVQESELTMDTGTPKLDKLEKDQARQLADRIAGVQVVSERELFLNRTLAELPEIICMLPEHIRSLCLSHHGV